MRWRCRCNKRGGEHRKTLTRHPDSYPGGRPKCHIQGCDGVMYALKTQNVSKDYNLPVCYCDCMPNGYPHKINSKGCRQYEEWVLDRSFGETVENTTEECDW